MIAHHRLVLILAKRCSVHTGAIIAPVCTEPLTSFREAQHQNVPSFCEKTWISNSDVFKWVTVYDVVSFSPISEKTDHICKYPAVKAECQQLSKQKGSSLEFLPSQKEVLTLSAVFCFEIISGRCWCVQPRTNLQMGCHGLSSCHCLSNNRKTPFERILECFSKKLFPGGNWPGSCWLKGLFLRHMLVNSVKYDASSICRLFDLPKRWNLSRSSIQNDLCWRACRSGFESTVVKKSFSVHFICITDM